MPPITALLHTRNDARRLGRALETLLPCAEILIVDHHSTDRTLRVAAEYGARILRADDPPAKPYHDRASYDWVLCLDPAECLTEGLQATLFEWSFATHVVPNAPAFSVSVREQVGETWRGHAAAETRLIPRNWRRWNGPLPAHEPSSPALAGELLRLAFP